MVTDQALCGRRVLVVEDEYLLADEMSVCLTQAGAVVLGPVASVRGALELLGTERELHAAILDINLAGETVFPVAEALTRRGVPFVFVSGYDEFPVPARFAGVLRHEKPVDSGRVIRAVGAVIPR